MDRFEAERKRMVDLTVAQRGVTDPAVLAAMRSVPRHLFLPEQLAEFAYRDTPLQIAEEQTISQPYIVALMLEAAAIGPGDRVLEIGAGSGYASAVASLVAGRVDAVERHAALADSARERLARLGYANVAVHCADGSGGWPEGAPFDAILVAAGGPRVPEALREQLAAGGRLVMPVGASSYDQRLVKITRQGERDFREADLGGVSFVPLIGAHGWAAADG